VRLFYDAFSSVLCTSCTQISRSVCKLTRYINNNNYYYLTISMQLYTFTLSHLHIFTPYRVLPVWLLHASFTTWHWRTHSLIHSSSPISHLISICTFAPSHTTGCCQSAVARVVYNVAPTHAFAHSSSGAVVVQRRPNPNGAGGGAAANRGVGRRGAHRRRVWVSRRPKILVVTFVCALCSCAGWD
jgi:hypothetical protein